MFAFIYGMFNFKGVAMNVRSPGTMKM